MTEHQESWIYQGIKINYNPSVKKETFYFNFCGENGMSHFKFVYYEEMQDYKFSISGSDVSAGASEDMKVDVSTWHKNSGEFLKDKSICHAIRKIKYDNFK